MLAPVASSALGNAARKRAEKLYVEMQKIA